MSHEVRSPSNGCSGVGRLSDERERRGSVGHQRSPRRGARARSADPRGAGCSWRPSIPGPMDGCGTSACFTLDLTRWCSTSGGREPRNPNGVPGTIRTFGPSVPMAGPTVRGDREVPDVTRDRIPRRTRRALRGDPPRSLDDVARGGPRRPPGRRSRLEGGRDRHPGRACRRRHPCFSASRHAPGPGGARRPLAYLATEDQLECEYPSIELGGAPALGWLLDAETLVDPCVLERDTSCSPPAPGRSPFGSRRAISSVANTPPSFGSWPSRNRPR